MLVDGINNHNRKERQMKCVICNEKITADPFGWEGGCNAEPVKEGQCCYTCDISVVLPSRIELYLDNKEGGV